MGIIFEGEALLKLFMACLPGFKTFVLEVSHVILKDLASRNNVHLP